MTSEKRRKILVNEDELLGVRCIDRPIGVKIGLGRCLLFTRHSHSHFGGRA